MEIKLVDIYNRANVGFYLFGGSNSKRKLNNETHILQLKKTETGNVYVWKILETTGDPPTPRYSHNSAYIAPYLYVYSGRNDAIQVQTY